MSPLSNIILADMVVSDFWLGCWRVRLSSESIGINLALGQVWPWQSGSLQESLVLISTRLCVSFATRFLLIRLSIVSIDNSCFGYLEGILMEKGSMYVQLSYVWTPSSILQCGR